MEESTPISVDTNLNFANRIEDRISGQGISLLGLCGFLTAWLICYLSKPESANVIFAVYAGLTAAPMVFASIVFNKTHHRASTGLDCQAMPLNIGRSLIKIVGLLYTIILLFLFCELLPEHWSAFYLPAWKFAFWLGGPFLLVTISYFLWVDRMMVTPEDGYWHMGLLAMGRWRSINWIKLKGHAFDWLIKGYFLPFMFTGSTIHLKLLTEKGINISSFGLCYSTVLSLIFSIDICFGAVGYLLTMRVLDAQIRSSEPTLLGWISAIMCYAPIGPLIWNHYLKYEGPLDWQDWLFPHPIIYISWGFAILVLLAIYTWSTCSFGCRFSNLTNRGIIVDGPYRYVKHPAYLSKNLAWWMISVPFVAHATLLESATACLCLFVTNLVYIIRALTEERHLMRDPAYVAYAEWISHHGLVAQIRKGLIKGA